MRATTLLNMKNQTVSAIDSLFSCAKIMGMSGQEISTAFYAILSARPNMPRYMRQYMQGYFDCLWKALYRDCLVFGGFYNEVFYSTHSNRPDYYGKHGIEPIEWAQKTHSGILHVGHYWIATASPKPF